VDRATAAPGTYGDASAAETDEQNVTPDHHPVQHDITSKGTASKNIASKGIASKDIARKECPP